jgi:hypothetical protein
MGLSTTPCWPPACARRRRSRRITFTTEGSLNAIALRLEVSRRCPQVSRRPKRGTALNAMEEQVRRLDRLLHRWLTLTTHSETAADACDLRVLMQEIFARRARGASAACRSPSKCPTMRSWRASPRRPPARCCLDLVRHALTGASGYRLRHALERNGGSARCHIHGAAFDDAATSLALRIASGLSGPAR